MPIQFTLKNAADGSTTMTAGRKNALVLTITNTGPGDVPLAGGTAVAQDRAATGPTAIYLNFTDVLGGDVPAAITRPPGWTPTHFDTPSPVWALTPDKDGPFLPNTSLKFAIDVVPVKPKKGSRVIVDAYRLGAATSSTGLPIDVMPAPAPKPLRVAFELANERDRVMISPPGKPIENTIALSLRNTSWNEPLVADDVKWQGDPEFYLRCVAGTSPGTGALTTAAVLASDRVQLQTDKQYEDRWKIKKVVEATPPYWLLTPLQHEVLGVRERALVQFRLTGIVTEFEPGLTQLYLEWKHMPGYDDGGVALTLGKARPVAIEFTGTPSVGEFDRGFVNVSLKWRALNATAVWLNGRLQKRTTAPETLSAEQVEEVRAPGQQVLRAEGEGTGNEIEAHVSVISVAEALIGRTFAGGTPRREYERFAPPNPHSFDVGSSETVTFERDRASYDLRVSGEYLKFVYNPRLNLLSRSGVNEARSVQGRWRVEGGTIVVTGDDGTVLQFKYTLQNDRLTLQLVTGGIVRVQMNNGPAIAAAPLAQR